MPTVDEHLHRQEVAELTVMLRNEPGFADLRQLLAGKGLAASEVYLAGFNEDENGGEYGAVVTPGGEVYSYERKTRRDASKEERGQKADPELAKIRRTEINYLTRSAASQKPTATSRPAKDEEARGSLCLALAA